MAKLTREQRIEIYERRLKGDYCCDSSKFQYQCSYSRIPF